MQYKSAYCLFMVIWLSLIINLVWKPLIIGSNRLKYTYCLAIFTTDNFYPKLLFTNVLIKSSLLLKTTVNNGGING